MTLESGKDRALASHSGFFAIRTPLLSIARFTGLVNHATAEGADDRSEQSTRARIRAALHAELQHNEVREALEIASPSLMKDISKWHLAPDSKHGRKIERALISYFTRMCSRTTPFGLFAGTALGAISDSDALVLHDKAHHYKDVNIDYGVLATLTEKLQIEWKDRLLFFPSPSIYRVADRLRFFRHSFIDFEYRTMIAEVDWQQELEHILDICSGGASAGTMVASLLREHQAEGIDEAEVEDFVSQLIEQRFVVPRLHPATTGDDVIHEFISRLQDLDKEKTYSARLEEIQQALRILKHEIGVGQESYDNMHGLLEGLIGRTIPRGKSVQVDLVVGGKQVELSSSTIRKLLDNILVAEGLRHTTFLRGLSDFAHAFRERYGEQWVPILEVLDGDVGIGGIKGVPPVPCPLLQALGVAPGRLPLPRSPIGAGDPANLSLGDLLAIEIGVAGAENKNELDLLPCLKLRGIKPQTASAGAYTAQLTIVASSAGAVHRGEFRCFLHQLWASGKILGRQSRSNPILAQKLREFCIEEAHRAGDSIVAEIVHLPDGREGNVCLRPRLRDYEIVLSGVSTLSEAHQMTLSDLLLTVVDDEIILYSTKHQRRVLPKLTNAHNFAISYSQDVYELLGRLEPSIGSPPQMLVDGVISRLPYTPRLTLGRLVISPRTWNINQTEVAELDDREDETSFDRVQILRKRRGFPRLVTLTVGQEQCLFDLDNPVSVDAMLHELRKNYSSPLALAELYPAPDEMWASDGEQLFCHNVLLPMFVDGPQRNEHRIDQRLNGAASPSAERKPRRYIPGEEWLCFKLYCGEIVADQLLQELVHPWISRSVADGTCDRWFFIRYGDPRFHLRLRFHGEPKKLRELFEQCVGDLTGHFRNGRIVDFQVVPYEPETTRYGEDASLSVCEQIFQLDSQYALQAMCDGQARANPEQHRCDLALFAMSVYARHSGLDQDELRNRLRINRDFRAQATGITKPALHDIGNKYRQERTRISSILNWNATDCGALGEFPYVREFAINCEILMSNLGSQAQRSWIDMLHLHCNRMFTAGPLQYETILSDYLARYYDSRIAKPLR